MNTFHDTDTQRNSHTLRGCALVGLLFGALLSAPVTAAGPDGSYQLGLLFDPSDSQLRAESRGRVMIYDRLDSEDVDRALETQFDRIEHMMFTRTRSEQPDGKGIVEDDDGC